jgi:hypothetical protein
MVEKSRMLTKKKKGNKNRKTRKYRHKGGDANYPYTAQEIMNQLQRHINLYGKNTPIRTKKDGIFSQVYGISYDDENKAITIEI